MRQFIVIEVKYMKHMLQLKSHKLPYWQVKMTKQRALIRFIQTLQLQIIYKSPKMNTFLHN